MFNIGKIIPVSYYKLTIVVGLLMASVSEAQPVNVERKWRRCNVIGGSPLCIFIKGNLNQRADIRVWYHKNSGPKRFAKIHLFSFGKRCEGRARRELIAQGTVKPNETIGGSKVRHIYLYSCWSGSMRIGNRQFSTGELITR